MVGGSGDRGTGCSPAVAAFRRESMQAEQDTGIVSLSAWETYEPALFRLAGFGGVALFLRASVRPDEQGRDVLGVDIGLLSASSLQWRFGREAGAGLSARLAQFFIAVAGEGFPELAVDPFRDDRVGLEFAVVTSDPAEVEFRLRVEPDQELLLRTTRAAVVQAGLDVRRLEDVSGLDDSVTEFPNPDWF